MTETLPEFWRRNPNDAQRLWDILEHSGIEIFVADARTLKLEVVNAAACANVQYSMDELRQMTLADIGSDFDADTDFADFVAQLADDRVRFVEIRTTHQRKDGSAYACSIRLELDRSDVQRPMLVALCKDISESERLQSEVVELEEQLAKTKADLIEAGAEAARAGATTSAFLANVSHEIRTPLNGVIGMTSALVQTGLSSQQTEMTDVVLSSGYRLLNLVNDILDLSKIEIDGIDTDVEATNAQSLLSEVAASCEAQADEKDLSVSIEISRSSHKTFLANANRIRQVIDNLVSNAIKFTDSGGITLAAELRNATASGRAKLTLTVTDSGTGVPDGMKNVIFGRFEQGAHTAGKEIGGVGLGLSIARTICELHGGYLRVEDAPGQGARFVATFEVGLPEAPAESSENADPAERLKALGRPLHILVAEDNEMNRSVMAALLVSAPGVTASYANNGWEALEKMKTETFDAALVDIRMPVMDGFEMISVHRENEARAGSDPMPIAACSANAMKEQIAHCDACGFGTFLPKPFDLHNLTDCLEWVVREIHSIEAARLEESA